MPLIKAFRMDGLGNRFIIIDRRKNSINIPKEKIVHLGNLKSFHRNIEFDQIIFIEKEINNTFPITIFNSDGGEVSACGNGSRCVAYLLSKDLNNKEIKLKTNNRLLNAKIVGEFDVQLEMGKPVFEWNKIPLKEKLNHKPVMMQIPIGSEDSLTGVVDLITKKAYYFEGEMGKEIREDEIPADMVDQFEEYREKMLDVASEYCDDKSDSDSLYKLLENEVIPIFYNKKDKWVEMIRSSITTSVDFTAHRMILEYKKHFYNS